MLSQTTAIEAADGHRLAVRAWLPEGAAPFRGPDCSDPAPGASAGACGGAGVPGPAGPRIAAAGRPRAIIQVVHGMAEHSGRYERFARAASAAGFAVVADDHRGHGETIAAPDERGHTADSGGWELVLDDLSRVGGAIAASWPGVPRVLLGHSWGSILVRALLARSPLPAGDPARVILMGTIGDPGALGRAGVLAARAQARLRGPRHPSTALDARAFSSHNAAFEPARTPVDWLSRDRDEVDAYLADPLCGFVCTSAFYRDLAAGGLEVSRPAAFAAAPVEVPVLVVSGSCDPVGRNGAGPRAVASAYWSAGVREVSLRLYPGARHELLNEINRDEVTDQLLAWAAAHL